MESAQLERAAKERRTYLRKLRVENFKSFEKIDLDLPDFSVFVGPNGSGKSNLVQAMRFIYDIKKLGLEAAISACGGAEFVKNFAAKAGSPVSFELQIESAGPCTCPFPVSQNEQMRMAVSAMTYMFKLDMGPKSGYTVIQDRAIFEGTVIKDGQSAGERKKITVTNARDGFAFVHDDGTAYELEDQMSAGSLKNSLMLSSNSSIIYLPAISMMLEKAVAIYDIDPKLAKQAIPVENSAVLKPDGSNFALFLKKLGDDPEKMRQLEFLVENLLHSAPKFGVDTFTPNTVLLNIEEKYFEGKKIPANLVSDSSIRLAAILAALYFQGGGLRVVEEPERGTHPSLAPMLVYLIKEASAVGQVLLTTHSPDILRCADIGDMYMVSRGDDGISTVARPHDVQEVKKFLDADMGIDDMHRHNLLENS